MREKKVTAGINRKTRASHRLLNLKSTNRVKNCLRLFLPPKHTTRAAEIEGLKLPAIVKNG